MHEAAQRLVGHHDFTTFREAECQAKSPMQARSTGSTSSRDGDNLNIEASARSFLHHQVRSMVGSLVRGRRGALVARPISRPRWTRATAQPAPRSLRRRGFIW